MTNTASKIGQDLLVKILSTLPPKSLMRFKCVAKWWYALINDHSFVDKHLSKSLHDNQSTCVFLKRMLVPTEDPNDNETQSVFSVLTFDNVAVDDDDDGVQRYSTLSGTEDFDVPVAMSLEIGDDQSFRVAGHCDGIICLAARPNSSKVILWNMTIQEFRVLLSETYIPDWFNEPSLIDPHLRWKRLPYHPRSDRFNDVLGLGYDPKSKDYQVVKIGFSDSELHRGTKHSIIHPPRVVAYTLGTDSWREIGTYSLETETTLLWPETSQLYFKGMCYWIGTEQQKEFMDSADANYDEYEYIRRVIVSFDMSREVFHDVLFPHDLFDFYGIIDGIRTCLRVWNESVALLHLDHFEDADKLTFEMWVMDDGSVGGANSKGGVWTKHLASKLPLMSMNPDPEMSLPMWKSDEVLLVEDNGCIVCCNIGNDYSQSTTG